MQIYAYGTSDISSLLYLVSHHIYNNAPETRHVSTWLQEE